jgi:hypothetical protein
MVVCAPGEGFQFGIGAPKEFVRVEKRGEWSGVAKEEAMGGGIPKRRFLAADLFAGDGEQVVKDELATAFLPKLAAVFVNVRSGEF